MPRPRNPVPSYLKHPSGKGRAVWTDPNGIRRFKLLPGPFGSAESKAAFGRLAMELAAVPHGSPVPAPDDPTVAEVLAAYVAHAARHYKQPDGSMSSEFTETRLTVRRVRELYADLPAGEFSPLKLKAVRESWVKDGLARSECNRRTAVARRIFRWASSEEMVPETVFAALKTVAGLQQGRTPARETRPVQPADPEAVRALLPHMPDVLAAVVRLQLSTGARGGELLAMRSEHVDRSVEPWRYTPPTHKTNWRGKARTIFIGPEGRRVLAPWLAKAGGGYVFPTPEGDRYEIRSYAQAMRRACQRANVPHTHPHQLRHLAAVTFRDAAGIDAARAALGHSVIGMTERYSRETDSKLAATVAAAVG